MDILRKIDKVLAAFGNIKAMERTHVDTYTEGLVSNIKGDKIAESKNGQLYADFQVLSDYEFLNVSILSRDNIKTFKGGRLLFVDSNKDEHIIESDTQEITSDFSNISNTWLTKVSFVIHEKEKKMILERKFEYVYFDYKKKSLLLYKTNQ